MDSKFLKTRIRTCYSYKTWSKSEKRPLHSVKCDGKGDHTDFIETEECPKKNVEQDIQPCAEKSDYDSESYSSYYG